MYQQNSEATFSLGLINDNWCKEEQPVECQYAIISSPSSCSSRPEASHPFMQAWKRPDPLLTMIDELEGRVSDLGPEDKTNLERYGRARKFGTLLGMSKACVALAVDEGTSEDMAELETMLRKFEKKMRNPTIVGDLLSRVTDPPKKGKGGSKQSAAQLARGGGGRGRGRVGRGGGGGAGRGGAGRGLRGGGRGGAGRAGKAAAVSATLGKATEKEVHIDAAEQTDGEEHLQDDILQNDFFPSHPGYCVLWRGFMKRNVPRETQVALIALLQVRH